MIAPHPDGRVLTRTVAVRVAVIYLLARLVTTGMMVAAAAMSTAQSRFGEDATVFSLAMGWDAQWYWSVAVDGYPSVLPTSPDGVVEQNAWAFMPLFPWVATVLSLLFGGSYPAGALVLSLVAGYLACLALYVLLAGRIDRVANMWAVALFSAGPLAAMFQVGYAEGLFALWLFLALIAVQRRSWWWLYALIPLMGYTRPGILAFSLMLALYGIWRFFNRRTDPLPVRDVVHIVLLGLLAAAVGFSWQIIAGVVTGDPSAYMETELSWRRGWTGAVDAGFVPVEGFLQAIDVWFGIWGIPAWIGFVGLVVVVVAIAAVLVRGRSVRMLGMEVRLWSASYLVYLLLVFFPQSSIFRLLFPLAPLYGALAAPRSTAWRAGLLLAGLVAQWWWIYNMYALGNQYYQIP